MEIFVSDIYNTLLQWAPMELAEDWDNSGLQLGDFSQKVSSIYITLDLNLISLDKALKNNTDLIITHHPLILKPLKSIDFSTIRGYIIRKLIKSNISLISMHTNLDKAVNGVSHKVSEIIGLKETKPIISEKTFPERGLGLMGRLEKIENLKDILFKLKNRLGSPYFLTVGEMDHQISKVAVCGGSGSDLWDFVKDKGIDLFISAEIKHHIALEARDKKISIIDLGHFYSEYPIVGEMAKFLMEKALEYKWNVKIHANRDETSPFNFL